MKNRIKGLIIHWSASPQWWGVPEIRKAHLANGWRDIGYHRVILYPDLKKINDLLWGDLVKMGRSLNNDKFITDDEAGAHAKGFNKDHVGICVIGNTNYSLHPLQKEALIHTTNIFIERFEIPKTSVKLHREVNPTQCPGDEISKLIIEWRNNE